MAELTGSRDIERVLEHSRSVAVVGAHPETSRPAFYVPDYLDAHGYRIIPVNPKLAGRTMWDQAVRASLSEVGEPVDVVDVFRRSEHLPDHVPDILAMEPRPRVIWFQLGIRNDEVASRLVEAGFDVIQDRCMLAEHRRLGVGR